MTNSNRALFGMQESWKIFDAYQYWKNEYITKKTFDIAVWEMKNKDIHSRCKVVNFACMEDMSPEDRKEMEHIVEVCISWDIVPDIDEVMQLSVIPRKWVEGHIVKLGDFHERFDSKGKDLRTIFLHFDKHLEPGDTPIPIALISSSREDGGSVFGEKELYVRLRESLSMEKLTNFKLGHVIYLSELIDDNVKDPIEIVKAVKDKGIADGRTYSRLIYDVKNLLSVTDTSYEPSAELVRIAHMHGILVDFSTESQHYEVQTYRRVYGRLYDFSTPNKIFESIKSVTEMYGNNYFLTYDFRVWYPITLTIKDDEEILISPRRGWDNTEDLTTIDVGDESFLVKLDEDCYRLNYHRMRGVPDKYSLVNEAYVYDDSTIMTDTKLKFF